MDRTITNEQLARLAKGMGWTHCRCGDDACDHWNRPDSNRQHSLDWLLTPDGMVWILERMHTRPARVQIERSRGESEWSCCIWHLRDCAHAFDMACSESLPHAVALAAMAVLESEGR